ncbi:unnamed protein product [Parajaminaea phylloscopi]
MSPPHFLKDEEPDRWDRPLPPDVATQIYTWADNPEHAVVLRNADLANIKLMGGRKAVSGLPIYQYGQRPCVFATIAGLVIGVAEKERRRDYLIDDGSSVIEVSHNTRSAMTSAAALHDRGTYSTFVAEGGPAHHLKGCEVGDIVKITGRIWSRQYPSTNGCASVVKIGLDVSTLLSLSHDPSAEADHNLEAHRLAQEEYCNPFEVPSVTCDLLRIHVPVSLATTDNASCLQDKEHEEARLADKWWSDLRRLHALGERRCNTASTALSYAERRPVREFNPLDRRIKSEDRVTSSIEVFSKTASPSPIPHALSGSARWKDSGPGSPHRSRITQPGDALSRAQTPCNRLDAESSAFASSSRPLRSPSKLKASECTQQYFRLHVQKFLVDFCSRPIAPAGNEEDLPLRNRGDRGAGTQPPSFAMAFLLRVKVLRELALRVVSVLLEARTKRHRRGIANTGRSAQTQMGEPKEEKVRRLFDWCVLQLVQDGFLVLAPAQDADPSHSLQWPYDGATSPNSTITGKASSCRRCRAMRTRLASRASESGVARLGTSRVKLRRHVRRAVGPELHCRSKRRLLAQLSFEPFDTIATASQDPQTVVPSDRKATKRRRGAIWQDVSMCLDEASDEDAAGDVLCTCSAQSRDDAVQPGSARHPTSKPSAEAYQVLTPAYLLQSLLPILQRSCGRSSNTVAQVHKTEVVKVEDERNDLAATREHGQLPAHHGYADVEVDVEWALYQLQRSDDRWRYTNVDSVSDALDLLRVPHHTVHTRGPSLLSDPYA